MSCSRACSSNESCSAEPCNMGDRSPRQAPQLCSVAAAAIARVGSLADCTLVAEDDSSYRVSKAVVAVHSSVLGRMFHDLNDTMYCVNLSDSAARVACLVNYIYGGSGFAISSDNLVDCACVADKYDMPHLQRAVEMFVLEQLPLSVDNVPGFMKIAHENPGLWELKQRCIEYTARRLQHILESRREGHPPNTDGTDWLTPLPQTTLIDIMQRRCSLIGGSTRASYACGPFVPLTENEIKHQESMFQEAGYIPWY